MKTVGLVVEYNPLHNGHKLHFEAAKEATGADSCVIVMSGNFLQRGEPALVSKRARAEMALRLGVDLVIELPLPFATANAELFAHGAISILDRLGVVDSVCFGSESGEISWMHPLAEALAIEPLEFQEHLKMNLSNGLAYPLAYAQAATRYMQKFGFNQIPLDQPNNILGFNYVLALKRLNSRMEAVTIQRKKADYHQQSITDKQIASATALRKLLLDDKADLSSLAAYVPETTLDVLRREFNQGAGPICWDHYRHPLFHRLLQLTPQELSTYHEIEEGMENRLIASVKRSKTVQELITEAKTRRFTWNRLQRMLLSVLLNLTKQEVASFQLKSGAPYARILGFSDKGQQLLKEARKKSSIPLITKARDHIHPMLDLDLRASAIYQLGQPNGFSNDFLSEYKLPPLTLASVSTFADN
ncbi:nucleotidyltransferase [Brevibacillus ginsengisoli]|uniref:nucleotidyltransferase n=1 Tax=Brevibacillus ginsengisoli TaxID=363854 RepID=UPI003CF77E35